MSDPLYGIPRPRHKPTHEISASSSFAFSSNLSSLLAASKSSSSSASKRPPKSRTKDDIFTAHKKSKKRTAAEISRDEDPSKYTKQLHKTKSDVGIVDSDTLARSKRKMEEKARLYAAMKRGDYVTPTRRTGGVSDDRDPLVDFDRKWVEEEAAGRGGYDTSSGDEDDDSADDGELVEYIDELGRARRGTKKEAAREARQQRIRNNAAAELEEMSARPEMPEGLIFGDAVQSAAFNPDVEIETRMADLAAKRDRSLTPPPETHYDASKEIRSKGVGFYQFSGDKQGRETEMGNLDTERKETERRREERKAREEERKAELEKRRAEIKAKKASKQADRFLGGLSGFLEEGHDAEEDR